VASLNPLNSHCWAAQTEVGFWVAAFILGPFTLHVLIKLPTQEVSPHTLPKQLAGEGFLLNKMVQQLSEEIPSSSNWQNSSLSSLFCVWIQQLFLAK